MASRSYFSFRLLFCLYKEDRNYGSKWDKKMMPRKKSSGESPRWLKCRDLKHWRCPRKTGMTIWFAIWTKGGGHSSPMRPARPGRANDRPVTTSPKASPSGYE
jgi:hypothetical protein